jgi:hypothetical protein
MLVEGTDSGQPRPKPGRETAGKRSHLDLGAKLDERSRDPDRALMQVDDDPDRCRPRSPAYCPTARAQG